MSVERLGEGDRESQQRRIQGQVGSTDGIDKAVHLTEEDAPKAPNPSNLHRNTTFYDTKKPIPAKVDQPSFIISLLMSVVSAIFGNCCFGSRPKEKPSGEAKNATQPSPKQTPIDIRSLSQPGGFEKNLKTRFEAFCQEKGIVNRSKLEATMTKVTEQAKNKTKQGALSLVSTINAWSAEITQLKRESPNLKELCNAKLQELTECKTRLINAIKNLRDNAQSTLTNPNLKNHFNKYFEPLGIQTNAQESLSQFLSRIENGFKDKISKNNQESEPLKAKIDEKTKSLDELKKSKEILDLKKKESELNQKVDDYDKLNNNISQRLTQIEAKNDALRDAQNKWDEKEGVFTTLKEGFLGIVSNEESERIQKEDRAIKTALTTLPKEIEQLKAANRADYEILVKVSINEIKHELDIVKSQIHREEASYKNAFGRSFNPESIDISNLVKEIKTKNEELDRLHLGYEAFRQENVKLQASRNAFFEAKRTLTTQNKDNILAWSSLFILHDSLEQMDALKSTNYREFWSTNTTNPEPHTRVKAAMEQMGFVYDSMATLIDTQFSVI